MFANVITNAVSATLPSIVTLADSVITNPSIAQAKAAGWRLVRNTESPATGYAFAGFTVEDVDGTLADLKGAGAYDIAAKAAADAAALSAQQLADAKASLAGAEPWQRVLWVVVTQLVSLINTERAQHGRAAITEAQIKTTLQNALQ